MVRLYKFGKDLLAAKKIHVHSTKGIVKVGSPYGKRNVLMLAVIGIFKQAALIPDNSAKRL